eukprot:c32442_g1_i1 orf=2-187(-)
MSHNCVLYAHAHPSQPKRGRKLPFLIPLIVTSTIRSFGHFHLYGKGAPYPLFSHIIFNIMSF